MHIEKALQRAKRQRLQDKKPLPKDQLEVKIVPSAKRDDWEAPVYSRSREKKIDFKKAEDNHCILGGTSCLESDSLKILKTQVSQLTKEKGWRTIMVTSVQPNEGKTVTTINLAFSMAREYQKTVMLVDCDFRKQCIYRYLGIDSRRGLVDYLMDDVALNEIIIWPKVEKICLISGGRPIPDSAELIGSPKMGALVSEMKARHGDRYMFFDFPPLLTTADAIAFTPYVDCVLIVVEAGRTSSRDIKKAVELIPAEKFLGFVLNKYKMPKKEYSKYYSYAKLH